MVAGEPAAPLGAPAEAFAAPPLASEVGEVSAQLAQ